MMYPDTREVRSAWQKVKDQWAAVKKAFKEFWRDLPDEEEHSAKD